MSLLFDFLKSQIREGNNKQEPDQRRANDRHNEDPDATASALACCPAPATMDGITQSSPIKIVNIDITYLPFWLALDSPHKAPRAGVIAATRKRAIRTIRMGRLTSFRMTRAHSAPIVPC